MEKELGMIKHSYIIVRRWWVVVVVLIIASIAQLSESQGRWRIRLDSRMLNSYARDILRRLGDGVCDVGPPGEPRTADQPNSSENESRSVGNSRQSKNKMLSRKTPPFQAQHRAMRCFNFGLLVARAVLWVHR